MTPEPEPRGWWFPLAVLALIPVLLGGAWLVVLFLGVFESRPVVPADFARTVNADAGWAWDGGGPISEEAGLSEEFRKEHDAAKSQTHERRHKHNQ